jgi:divalent metal cation (Fe/Co/Zn/Cd) transporter
MGGDGAYIAMGFSLFFTCGNVFRWFRLRKCMAADERSPVLMSQYKATNASIIVNAGSFLAIALSLLLAGYSWAGYIDPVVSILLSGFILLNAYLIMSSSMGDLLDRSADESIQLIIMGALAEFFDEYTQVLGIRSRKSGGTIFIEIVLEFENSRTIGDIQAVTDRMQRSLEGKVGNSRITIIPRAAEK